MNVSVSLNQCIPLSDIHCIVNADELNDIYQKVGLDEEYLRLYFSSQQQILALGKKNKSNAKHTYTINNVIVLK